MVFEGAELEAIFGGVECNLQKAIIEKDVHIEASAIFGGIEIKLPENVNVKLSSTGILGGSSNKRGKEHIENAPTVYIHSTGVFGGVDIK